MEETTTEVELDFENNPVLSLSECLDYLEDKCNYVGIKKRFMDGYMDFPEDSEMYDEYGIFFHHFGTVVEDEKRMHDEAIFRSIFNVEEAGVYFRA